MPTILTAIGSQDVVQNRIQPLEIHHNPNEHQDRYSTKQDLYDERLQRVSFLESGAIG